VLKKKFKKIAINAALRAGSYIKKNIGKVTDVSYKSDINVVTNVDKRSEEIIINILRGHFPSHGFIAEEKNNDNSDTVSSAYKWVIDPLDGTTNFLHGYPVFCVSIALEYRNNIMIGVVYDPMRDELFYAERRKGAFLNKKRIRVSRINKLKESLLSTGFAYNVNFAKNNNIDNFVNFIKTSQAVRRGGSAALDLCYVACGRLEGFWELFLHPWDTAAGRLIAEEAGGRVSKFDGSGYSIYDKEILVSNSKIHSQMIQILNS